MIRRKLIPLVAIALPTAATLVPQAVYAVGEQNGKIAGILTDKQSGAPIPTAKVTVTGANLVGGARSVSTGEDGSYEFIALPPGPYTVEFTFEGMKPFRRKVIVRLGETFPLNVAWTPEEAKQEVKTIYEERKMTRPDSTQTGTVLSADQQSRVATGRSYQAVTAQVAGVSTGGGNPNIKGAMNNHNRYLVDGLDITDPVTNTFSSNINFDSIESVEVATGGTEAQYNSLGGIINLTTSAGSNEWKLDASFYVNHQALSMGSQFGSQFYDYEKPFARLRKSPNASYQANVNVGGPLVKNKLWFHFSFQYRYNVNSVNIAPPFNLQHAPGQSSVYLARLKIAYAPTPKHRLTLSVSTDPAFFNNTNQDNLRLGVAEDHQDQGGFFSILTWDYFATEKINTNIQAGVQYSFLNNGPQGMFGPIDNSAYVGSGRFSTTNDVWEADRPQHYNAQDGTYWYNGGNISFDKRYTVQFDPSISVRGSLLGKHEAKFGVQFRYNRHTADISYPGNKTFTDLGGGGGEAGLCLEDKMQTSGCYQYSDIPAYTNAQNGFSVGLFAQDRWKITNWLRINPGLRFDYGRTTNTVDKVVSNMFGFGPRLGLVFDITQDQKTIFTAYYGRSNEVLSLLASAYADISGLSTTYQWNQPDPMSKGVWDKLYTSGGDVGYLVPDGGTKKPPHTDEVTLSFRREIFQNSSAGVDYTYKRVGDIWDSKEVNQIWDPTGSRVIGYANGNPEKLYLYTTFENNWRIYQGVDFLFESRPRQEWDFAVIYTLSWLYGPGGEQFAQISGSQNLSQNYNPRMLNFYDGWLPEDRRHTLKIRASYEFKGFTFGAFMVYQTGTPRTKRYFNALDGDYNNRRSPTGTEPGATPNDVTSIAEFRIPPTLQIDARISYDLVSVFKKVHVTLIADLFNMINLDQPTSTEVRDVPTFGVVRARQTPLRAQLGLRLQY